jgi:hypothetical protein
MYIAFQLARTLAQIVIVATESESMNLPTARPGVGENESSKSMPFSIWKPRTINLALK